MHIRCWITLVCGTLAGLALSISARAIDVSPQWMHTPAFEGRSSDTPSLGDAPSWATLQGGDIVVATRADDYTVLLRRLTADGSVVHSSRASVPLLRAGSAAIVVRTDPANSDIVVLAGSDLFCGLQRFNDDFSRQWSITIPGSEQMSSCLDLAVLDDGSALVLRHGSLSRVDTSGSVVWTIENGDDNHYLDAYAMVLGIDDTIWIAGRGDLIDGQSANHVAVQRFTPSGGRLAADVVACSGCISTVPGGIARGPDGEVYVVGFGGSPQKGFFARYAADGTRLLLTEHADTGYRDVVSDDSGAVFAQTFSDEVRRLGAIQGSVLWTRPAVGLVGVDDGVVLLQRSDSNFDLVAVRLDGAGDETWREPISTDFPDFATAPSGLREADRVSWLISDARPLSDTCGSGPRFVSLAHTDGMAIERVFCDMPIEPRSVALDSREVAGVALLTDARLMTFAADGALRWQAQSCSLCNPGNIGFPTWAGAVLRTDGGAWVLERQRSSAGPVSRWDLFAKQFDVDGSLLASIPLGPDRSSFGGTTLLLAPDDGLIVLTPFDEPESAPAIIHQRIDGSGQLFANSVMPMPELSTMVRSARVLDDGGISFATVGLVICTVGCPPFHVGITRVDVAGTILWQYFFGESVEAEVALEADGTSSALLRDAGGTLVRRPVAANGVTGADVAVVGMDLLARIEELSPMLGGHHAVVFSGPGNSGIALLDTQGMVLATRNLHPQTLPLVTLSVHGFLTTDYLERDADADLLSTESFETTARFRFPESALPISPSTFGRWSVLDQGEVYAATTVIDGNGVRQLAIARFNVPGTDAERIFTSGFDGLHPGFAASPE